MRFIRSAATTLTLASAAILAASAGPAYAGQGPVVAVTPSVATPGTRVTFAINCGEAISAVLFGTTLGLSRQIPMQGSASARVFAVTIRLPNGIRPGGYSPSIDCSNGLSGTAELTVSRAAGPPTPSGVPVTGDGATSSATGGPFAMAGLTLLAAGGIAVAVGFIRKRRQAGARSPSR